MSREKEEAELVREALRVGALYMKKRGAGEFEPTDGAGAKVRALYRLLVHDGLIQPLAKGQDNERNMKHKLALWIERQLPEGHPLKT
ncbi:DUF5062 domain-containing protein [Marinobacterium nitratireducens]|uniref:DUF5062 domain-containing protein n=1 Tax=Marinobacterium nitratireducens TaxID=518897 RepID=A0A918DYD9_9GAMM|nr:DUF5062 family protein [Marinobacterium nitratireducens]GGO88690.1 DUF5062 domain-containing protein [Marinobacterium nitratireducens]